MSLRQYLSIIGPIKSLNRDLKLLFISNFIWTLGFGLYNYVWPVYIRELGGSAADVGTVFSVSFLIAMVTYIPGGILADKYDRKKLIVISCAIAVPSALIYSVATDWRQLIPGVALYYLSFIGIPALYAYISSSAQQSKATSAFGVTQSGLAFGMVLSPTIGAYLLAVADARWIFRFSFVLYVFSTLILLFMTKQDPKTNGQNKNISYLKILKNRKAVSWTLALFFASFAVFLTMPYVPLFLEDLYGVGAVKIQILGSITSLGMALLGIWVGELGDRWNKRGALSFSLLLFSCSILFLLSFGQFPIIVLAMFLLGISRIIDPIVYSAVGSLSPQEARGKSYSVYQTVDGIAWMCAPYLGGYMYQLSPHAPFLIALPLTAALSAISLLILQD